MMRRPHHALFSCRTIALWTVLLVLAVALPVAAQQNPDDSTPSPTSTVLPSTPTPTGTLVPTATGTPTFERTPALPNDDLSGPYRGTWSSSTGAGALTLTLAQSEQRVEGTAVFRDHPCLTVARLAGRVFGNTLSGTLTSSGTVASGNTRLTVSPGGLSGTFSLVIGCPEAANGIINVVSTTFATPVRTPSSTPTRVGPSATPTPTATATPTLGPVGDCNSDGAVTVDEILAMVSIGLSTRPLDQCPVADRNFDGQVTVEEILQGIFAALSGLDSTDTPPPRVGRCPGFRGSDCRCRGEVCCLAGFCALGEPCDGSADCSLGLVCEPEAGGRAVCVDDATVVLPPPPR